MVIGVYYRPPDQGETVDKAFLLQLWELSCSQALVLVGDFNHLDICWKDHMASCKRSRRLVESIDDNFLVQVVDRPTRGEVLLDLLLTNAEEIIKDVNVGGSLGCSDHALVKFVILRNVGLAKRVVRTLNFGKANFICWPRSPGTLSLETKMLRKADYVSRMPISEHKRSPSF